MTKRVYKLHAPSFVIPSANVTLPTEFPIAAYYRQSTLGQVGNISTAVQMIDLPAHLQRLGWQASDILLIDMDKGVSGTTKIDERDGMRYLFDLITQCQIRAVACEDEDRLFRDVTQIQVNIFIEACRASNVIVITPGMIYDFANEITGTFHARQFRFKSEMAAEYITSVIRGRLQKAKRRMLLDGRWAGAGMPVGYMVDLRKTLPDGSPNSHWRRYVPFEPYASVIVEYFKLFLHFGGSIRRTIRHIHTSGPWYPDPRTRPAPEGFKASYRRMTHYEKGFAPSRTALREILTNAAYIGHWAVNDAIVHWSLHSAIVPLDLFQRAYNYLSDITLEGAPNPNYRPVVENARPSREEERGVPRPLCAGLIFSMHEGAWRQVGTYWTKPLKHYAYQLLSKGPIDGYVWSRAASFVDEAVAELLRRKLEATFNKDTWDEAFAKVGAHVEVERRGKQAQLTTLEQVMANQLAGLEVLSSPDMVKALESRYEAAKTERARLLAELAGLDTETQRQTALITLKDSCGPALENWDNLDRNERRSIFHDFIQRIEATPVDEAELRLVVHWRDKSRDELSLATQAANYRFWMTSEVARLKDLLAQHASQVAIAAAFPDRKWQHIREKISRFTSRNYLRAQPKPIRGTETYNDFLARGGLAGLHWYWLPDQVEQLVTLLDASASQLEIAAVFPKRKWDHIRYKAATLRPGMSLRMKPKPILDTETYEDFIARAGSESLHRFWTPAQMIRLRELQDAGASQLEIASEFPKRQWHRIVDMARKIRPNKPLLVSSRPMKSRETYETYQKRIGRQPSKRDSTGQQSVETRQFELRTRQSILLSTRPKASSSPEEAYQNAFACQPLNLSTLLLSSQFSTVQSG